MSPRGKVVDDLHQVGVTQGAQQRRLAPEVGDGALPLGCVQGSEIHLLEGPHRAGLLHIADGIDGAHAALCQQLLNASSGR